VRPARMIYLSLSCIPRQEWAAASGVQAAVNAVQYAWLERRIARDADAVVVASARHAADLRTYERLRGLDTVVLHPVFPSPRPQAPARAADGAVTIVAVGRLEPGKNFAAVIALAARLRDLPCRFVIAGDGPEMATLRVAAETAGVGDIVALPGVITDMPGLLDQADIFIHPSHYESFGIAPFEAMRAGLPVLCAPTLGCAEIMRDGVDAVFADFADLDGTASALRRLIADGLARARIGAAARQTSRATLRNDYVAGFRRVVERVMAPA
jgi:glycosyltransferase involved in cell wall biosynthesis